ncbi:MAG: PadR family transcriptional regulator [Cyanobacteria bacterium P01_A01_bin.17]
MSLLSQFSTISAARAAPKSNDTPKQACKPTPREQLILFAIGEHERYGLAIQDAIHQCSNGAESISIGSLYPTLTSLEKKGLVKSRPGTEVSSERCDKKRKYFRLTDDGKAAIEDILAFQKKLLSWDD